jgi:hypothetical protein
MYYAYVFKKADEVDNKKIGSYTVPIIGLPY